MVRIPLTQKAPTQQLSYSPPRRPTIVEWVHLDVRHGGQADRLHTGVWPDRPSRAERLPAATSSEDLVGSWACALCWDGW